MKQDCRTCRWGEYAEPSRGHGFRRIECKYPVPDSMPLAWSYQPADLNSGKVYIAHCEYYNEIEMDNQTKCPCWKPKKKASVGLEVVKPSPFAEREPELRHECSVCGRRFAWGEESRWWGSEKELEEGKPILKFCGACCRQKWWREKRGRKS